ncbi:hypothetical protein TNCV_1714061 [Trichonephila clavipes]|nr:hypothetical protein TNCV_1714061 [Trichonephila clavipes]
MGLQVIMSGDDSEPCHTFHSRKKDRKLSTSLAIEQTRQRFANIQVCKSGNSLLSKFVPEKSLGVSKTHRKARWMQRRSLFGQLVGLFISMNAAMRWDPLESNLSSGAKK